MSLEVNVKTVAPQHVLSITHHIKVDKLDTTIRTSLDDIYAILKEQNIEAADAPFGIYHGAINEQEDGPIEICLPVNGSVKCNVEVSSREEAMPQA